MSCSIQEPSLKSISYDDTSDYLGSLDLLYPEGYNYHMDKMINTINEYVTLDGKSPYADWLNALKDKKTKAIIIGRVDRLELNNFGDSKSVGDGVYELRIAYGPGYRVYYAKDGKNIYLLLSGGDKSTQSKDIKLAKKYWIEHKSAEK